MSLADQVALDVGAAGALLFGKQKLKVSGDYYGDPVSGDRSKSVIVPNLEASAALSWFMAENAKFSLGYRVDSYFGVTDAGEAFAFGTSGEEMADRDKGNRIIHGPFLKLTVGGGG